MPQPLIECVANVSEGRSAEVLAALRGSLTAVPGCRLLHEDVGAGANRTVFTFAGAPEAVFSAAFALFRTAAARIDMRQHRGEHPRLGAVDVCPFVPVSGIGEEELLAGTRELCRRIATELGLPIYAYERSATAPHRRNLADVRRGQYEGLPAKLRDPDWRPDFGPATFHPAFGAAVVGVRPFLIAWNINLSPASPLAAAKQLARLLRGAAPGGLFPGLKAIGWRIPEYGRCQVSCNVVDPDRVDMARVYLTAADLAPRHGARVTGSELIGLVPERYLRRAGRPLSPAGGRADQLDAAVTLLGLDELGPFDWRERVLEEILH